MKGKLQGFKEALLASVPLLFTPALVYVLAEGWLDFGGGEKDILLAFPWLIWSLVFFISALVLIFKHWPLRHWLVRSALVATFMIILLAVIAYWMSWLGVA